MRINALCAGKNYQYSVYNVQNKKPTPATPEIVKNSQKYISSTKISFKGAVNQNQILVLAAECTPYSVSGGLGAVIRDMTKAYKENYPQKDLRLMLPFYNAGFSAQDDKIFYEVDGVKAADGKNNLKFELEKTGIKKEFSYGVRKSTAELFKAKNPENGVTTYFLYCPEFKDMKKQYALDDYSLFERYCAFSNAAVALRGALQDSKEAFNPAILHTNDWHTAFAAFRAQNCEKDLKTVHALLNANAHFQGKYLPFAAALNAFTPEQIDRLIQKREFKREIMNLVFDNSELLLNEKTRKFSTGNLNLDLNDKEFMLAVLQNTAENYQKLFNDPKNELTYSCINEVMREEFKDVCWDENRDFNATVNALKGADAWFTISKTHLGELLTQSEFSSLALYNMMRVKLNKGTAILNKIDINRYDPKNPEQVKYPYDLSSFVPGKAKNKEFLFRQFSKNNIINKNFDKKLINNPNTARISGYLNPMYKNYPLAMTVSRFDTNQKGSDIALKTAEILLKQNKKINFVFALPDINNLNAPLLKSFEKNVIEKYPGRVVVIDAYVPINEYAAAADLSIIPSRSETCGLVGYQSMRMGAIPVSAPVGSMNDCLITPYHDIKTAMGFKAPLHFLNASNPAKILASTLNTAVDFYYDEPKQFQRMIKNSMLYDSSWNSAVKEQNELYEKTAAGLDIGNLTLNDLKEPEERHNLTILRKDDIKNLQKADVLVLLSHADDEIFFLPVMEALNKGKSVQFVYTAKGEKGHYKAGAPNTENELVKHRENELLDALNALGVERSPIMLEIPDLELWKEENKREISELYEKIIEKVRPQEVWSFGPDGITGNNDHKITGKLAFDTVNAYKKSQNPAAKLYQPALTPADAQRFKDYSSYTTDAFDFASPSKVPPAGRINAAKYRDKFEKSLNIYKSQWTPNEVKAIADFYTNTPVSYTSLETFPEVDGAENPWLERENKFKTTYGSDFEEFNSGISFKPAGKNYKVNLYLGNFNKDKKHIWVETSGLKNIDTGADILNELFENASRITKIPQFSEVEYFDIVFYAPNGKLKILFPVNEMQDFKGMGAAFARNPISTLFDFRRKKPGSNIRYSYI